MNTCQSGWFCNAAALCELCPFTDDLELCTPNCIHCQKPVPICLRHHPFPNQPEDSECVECILDTDCQMGFACMNHTCQLHRPPALACPGSGGHAVGADLQPTDDCNAAAYSPCTVDADCPDGLLCDLLNTRCVDKLPDCRTNDKCGKDCIDCGKLMDGGRARPYCLDGQVCVECRIDTDCGAGNYCLSGSCVACTDDRHCGPGCANCAYNVGPKPECLKTATDTPFCFSPNSSSNSASCVACTVDADCGDGAPCDKTTHTCAKPRSAPVECVSDSQCLCGSCDPTTNSCVSVCKDNTDCQGNQCCALGADGIRACQSGRCAGTAGGALCGCSVTGKGLGGRGADNNTLSADGGEAERSRGVLFAMVAMLLAGALFRRARMPQMVRREVRR